MNTYNHTNNLSLRLQRHALQHISDAPVGTIVICEKGLVFLTESDDLRDYTLRPGHQFVIRKKGDVLVEGLDDTRLNIIYPN